MDVGRTANGCWSIDIIARGLFSRELEGAGRGQNLRGGAVAAAAQGRAVREMRANGMETPFHPLQITTWFLFPVVTGECLALLMPCSRRSRYIVTPCYCLFVALSLLSATVTSGIDPHDPHVPTNPRPSSTLVRARARGGGGAAASPLSRLRARRAFRRAVAVSRAPPRLTRSARAFARARVLARARARTLGARRARVAV